jgi:hypothetical protein
LTHVGFYKYKQLFSKVKSFRKIISESYPHALLLE